MRVTEAYQVSPMSRPAPSASAGFSERLAERAGAGPDGQSSARAPVTSERLQGALLRRVESIDASGAEVDAAIRRISEGADLSQAELLRLQATVYAWGQNVEVATRVVDRAAGAVRHLLNLQL